MQIVSMTAALLVMVLLSTVFGPSVYIGFAVGVLVDRVVIVPAARALARNVEE